MAREAQGNGFISFLAVKVPLKVPFFDFSRVQGES